jgi:hypothetical protein
MPNVSDRFRYQETWQWKAPEFLKGKVINHQWRSVFPTKGVSLQWRLSRNWRNPPLAVQASEKSTAEPFAFAMAIASFILTIS